MEHLGPLQKPPATHFLSFSPPPTPIDFSSLSTRPHFHDSSRRSNSLQYTPPRSPWDDKAPPNHEGIPAEASWLHSAWEQPTGSSGIDASVKNGVDDAATAALCRSWDFWDDSAILQHKRTAEDHHQPVGENALVVEDDCGVLLCESRSSAKDSFAFPAVSGSRAIPFACKLDDAAAEDRDVGFASLSSRAEERNPTRGSKGLTAAGFPVKIEMDEGLLSRKESVGLDVRGALQANLENACNHHEVTDKRGKGGGQKAEEANMAMLVKKEIDQQGDGQGGPSAARDASIGLKLGKRTYFEDGGAGVGGGGGGGGVGSANLTTNSSSNNTGGGGSKKQKASSPTGVVPRCQAEGCKTDLSNAKDYHRRHKVCEWHAKASKAKVGNLEQRFCQQCSRFHVLSEFDEGKRSCRRRLAGHNERRRKPQPEAVSLLSSGSFAFLPDDSKHSLSSAFLQHPFFMQHSTVAPSLDHHSPSLACQLRLPGSETQVLKLLRAAKEEPLSTGFPSLELHHFLQNNSAQLGGHSLALSQPPPGSAVRFGAEALSPASQPPSGIAISGRALSLLSSLGSPNNACSMSLNVSPHHPSPSLEQLFAENQAASRQIVSNSDGQPCFLPVADKLVGMATPPHSLTNSRGGSPNGLDGEQRGQSAMTNFEGRAMFTMLQENGFHGLRSADSQHGRPILDLMQIPSPQSHHVSRPTSMPQVGFRYSELEGLRSYDSMFGRQNIL